MDYTSWRITFQDGEQAARAAFARVVYLHGGNVMLQGECERLNEAFEKMCQSRDFYMRRCEALQAVQDKMRDPERKAVCDILANGSTQELGGDKFRFIAKEDMVPPRGYIGRG